MSLIDAAHAHAKTAEFGTAQVLLDLAAALNAANMTIERLKAVVELGHLLRQNGERAPGGNETWREFDRRTESALWSLVTPSVPEGPQS